MAAGVEAAGRRPEAYIPEAAGEEAAGSLVHTSGLDWQAASGRLDFFLIRKDLHHVGRATACRMPRRRLRGGTVTADIGIIIEEQAPSDTACIIFL